MKIGQPPLPVDVRTPPTSRPKGSALKKAADDGLGVHQSAPGRLTHGARSRLANASGPGGSKSASKAGQGVRGLGLGGSVQKQQRAGGGSSRKVGLKSPGSLPRPRASEFF